MYKYKNNFIQGISVFKLNELNIGEGGGGVGGVPCLFVPSSRSGAILSDRKAIPAVSKNGSCYWQTFTIFEVEFMLSLQDGVRPLRQV